MRKGGCWSDDAHGPARYCYKPASCNGQAVVEKEKIHKAVLCASTIMKRDAKPQLASLCLSSITRNIASSGRDESTHVSGVVACRRCAENLAGPDPR